MEGLAITPDGKMLVGSMQAPYTVFNYPTLAGCYKVAPYNAANKLALIRQATGAVVPSIADQATGAVVTSMAAKR